MSKKSSKVASLISNVASVPGGEASFWDPHYIGYFYYFNQQLYYEAHDILEELWLETKGDLHLFYKGLIQLAGAFVHLKKSKLNPAARLFRLALKNLEPYAPKTNDLDLEELISRIRRWLSELEDSEYSRNPYDSQFPPRLELLSVEKRNQ